jgi:hypothetical protein
MRQARKREVALAGDLAGRAQPRIVPGPAVIPSTLIGRYVLVLLLRPIFDDATDGGSSDGCH